MAPDCSSARIPDFQHNYQVGGGCKRWSDGSEAGNDQTTIACESPERQVSRGVAGMLSAEVDRGKGREAL